MREHPYTAPCGCKHDGKHTWHWCPVHEPEHREAFARSEKQYRERWAREDHKDLL